MDAFIVLSSVEILSMHWLYSLYKLKNSSLSDIEDGSSLMDVCCDDILGLNQDFGLAEYSI